MMKNLLSICFLSWSIVNSFCGKEDSDLTSAETTEITEEFVTFS